MSNLEHFCVGRGGQSRLKSSVTAGTVVRVEGHEKGTSAFEFVRRLKETKMANGPVGLFFLDSDTS
jgi:hypothetical protein